MENGNSFARPFSAVSSPATIGLSIRFRRSWVNESKNDYQADHAKTMGDMLLDQKNKSVPVFPCGFSMHTVIEHDYAISKVGVTTI